MIILTPDQKLQLPIKTLLSSTLGYNKPKFSYTKQCKLLQHMDEGVISQVLIGSYDSMLIEVQQSIFIVKAQSVFLLAIASSNITMLQNNQKHKSNSV